MLVAGLSVLDLQDLGNFSPCRTEAMGRWRKFMPDCAVQRAKIVARHGSIHMMLGVVVHVPVDEPYQRIDRERPAA